MQRGWLIYVSLQKKLPNSLTLNDQFLHISWESVKILSQDLHIFPNMKFCGKFSHKSFFALKF
jgi:hypothetical protein